MSFSLAKEPETWVRTDGSSGCSQGEQGRASLHPALYPVGPGATHWRGRGPPPCPRESQQEVPGEDPLSTPLLPGLSEDPESFQNCQLVL